MFLKVCGCLRDVYTWFTCVDVYVMCATVCVDVYVCMHWVDMYVGV